MEGRGRVTVKPMELKTQAPHLHSIFGVAGRCGEFQVRKEAQVAIKKYFYINSSDKSAKDISEDNRLSLQ